MSKQKIAVSLDKNLVTFLDRIAQGNRSEYLNHLLAQHQEQVLQSELIAALKEDSEDPNYQQEIQQWDSVIGDGLLTHTIFLNPLELSKKLQGIEGLTF